jgi:hypothetical protein
MALRRSHTTTLVRNELWQGTAASEPYEAGWATEAIFFVRALDAKGALTGAAAHVQISPDGIHWVDEGTNFALPATAGAVTFARVAHFGGFLRLRASLPAGAAVRVIASVALKE